MLTVEGQVFLLGLLLGVAWVVLLTTSLLATLLFFMESPRASWRFVVGGATTLVCSWAAVSLGLLAAVGVGLVIATAGIPLLFRAGSSDSREAASP